MAKKNADTTHETDDQAQAEAVDASQETTNATHGKPMTKKDLIQDALNKGFESPTEGVDYIKRVHHRDDVTKTYFSLQKSKINNPDGPENPRPAKTTSNTPSSTTGGVNLPASFGSDVVKLKTLVDAAGGTEKFTELLNDIISLHQKYRGALTQMVAAYGD